MDLAVCAQKSYALDAFDKPSSQTRGVEMSTDCALTGRAAHGEWSRYVQRLIRADLAQRAQGANHAQL